MGRTASGGARRFGTTPVPDNSSAAGCGCGTSPEHEFLLELFDCSDAEIAAVAEVAERADAVLEADAKSVPATTAADWD
jgi:hypothetical protein